MTPPRVAVIGGGVSGLATAALLARGGAQVTVLERHSDIGGRTGKLEVAGYRFDTGPSWYLMPEAFEQFFALTGRRIGDVLELEDLDPRYRVYFEGEDPQGPAERLDVMADAEANWTAFDALSPGEGAAMRAYAYESTDLYTLALRRFLYTTFERPLAVVDGAVLKRSLRLPFLLGRSLGSKIAAKVKDSRLRQVLGFHAVFLGSSPDRAPALFSLMSHLDLRDGVRYPRGGMFAVIEALATVAREEGAQIRTSARVTRIVTQDGAATAVELESGEVLEIDLVVGATDMHHVETALLDAEVRDRSAQDWERKSPGVSALLVFVGVEGELPQLAHHTLFFSRDWDANFAALNSRQLPPHPASVYVSRTSATDPTVAPPGHEALVMLVPYPADPAVGADGASRDMVMDHAERYLTQVGEWASIPNFLPRAKILDVMMPADFESRLAAWQGSALGLEHTLRQSAMFRPGNRAKRVSNLLYAGASTIPGVGVPICLISAELVAKRLLGDTSAGPMPGPLEPGFLARSRRRDILGRIARSVEPRA